MAKIELVVKNNTHCLLKIDRRMNMNSNLSFTEIKIDFSFIRLWKNLRMIHKMFIPRCSIVQRIYHGTLTFWILNHIKLSSASAFGASFTFECTKTQQSSTVSSAWRWMRMEMYHTLFSLLLQVTWGELSFIPEGPPRLPRLWLTTITGEVFSSE